MKIDFVINGFSDSLNLPDDHTLTVAEIEAMKQARYNNWRAVITAVNDDTVVDVVATPTDEV